MKRHPDSQSTALFASWEENAQLWTAAVRESTIASRAVGTDQAIVDAVLRCTPRSVVDIGCGEGWLVRRLSQEHNLSVLGIDGSSGLIGQARDADPQGIYNVLTYDRLHELTASSSALFDVAICNFALLDEDLVTPLQAIRQILDKDGHLIIQTLHPWSASADGAYEDGWREETFSSFASGDWQPMPWYFRTLGSWIREIARAGMHLVAIEEPLNPATGHPLSILMTCAAHP